MRPTTEARTVVIAALVLLLQCSRITSALHLGIHYNDRENTGSGWHDLKAIAKALERAGHKVYLDSWPRSIVSCKSASQNEINPVSWPLLAMDSWAFSVNMCLANSRLGRCIRI